MTGEGPVRIIGTVRAFLHRGMMGHADAMNTVPTDGFHAHRKKMTLTRDEKAFFGKFLYKVYFHKVFRCVVYQIMKSITIILSSS